MFGGTAYRRHSCCDSYGRTVSWVEYRYASDGGTESSSQGIDYCDSRTDRTDVESVTTVGCGDAGACQGEQGPPLKEQLKFRPVNRVFPKLGIVRRIHAPPGGWGFFKGAFS